MALWNLFLSTWTWEPSVIFGCLALLLGYVAALRFRLSRSALYFFAGVFVLLLALISPLDMLGDLYLLSAHMLQHLLLVLVVPPLLLLGIPESLAQEALHWPLLARLERLFMRPLVAWFIGVGTLTLWHAPALYEAALEYEPIHILEHLAFIASSVIFWLPVLTPLKARRLSPLATAWYLMPAASATTLLGLAIAYAPHVLYPFYLRTTDPRGILFLLRDQWGINAKSDQETAGLMMWVPGSFVYLGAIMIPIARWFNFSDQRSEA